MRSPLRGHSRTGSVWVCASCLLLVLSALLFPTSAAQAQERKTGTVTGTITVAPATLPLKDCLEHPVTLNLDFDGFTDPMDWSIGIKYTDADGAVFVSGQFVGDVVNGPVTVETAVMLCVGISVPAPPGTYSVVADIYPKGFIDPPPVVSVPPVTFTVSQPVQDVTGFAERHAIPHGVRFLLKSEKTPSGALEGKPLTWKAKYDGKSKKVVQVAGETDRMKIKFQAHTGKHTVILLRNGKHPWKTVVKT